MFVFVCKLTWSRLCKGCRKVLPVAEFPFDSPDLHFQCKYNKDAIYTIAKSQSELKWFNACRSDDSQFYLMMENYRLHKVAVSGGQVGRVQWKLLVCKHSMIAQKSIELKDHGIFMNQRYFLQWNQDTRLHNMSRARVVNVVVACMSACMYACMSACMYVCMYASLCFELVTFVLYLACRTPGRARGPGFVHTVKPTRSGMLGKLKSNRAA